LLFRYQLTPETFGYTLVYVCVYTHKTLRFSSKLKSLEFHCYIKSAPLVRILGLCGRPSFYVTIRYCNCIWNCAL